jgi:hypothetical protein
VHVCGFGCVDLPVDLEFVFVTVWIGFECASADRNGVVNIVALGLVV